MHEALHRQLIEAGLGGAGETPGKLRQRIAFYARDVTLGRTVVARLEAPVERLMDLVAREARAIEDADVQTLRPAHSDEALFELTVVAAVACGMQRLEDAMALLKESQS